MPVNILLPTLGDAQHAINPGQAQMASSSEIRSH
jgi:hypothetical protein